MQIKYVFRGRDYFTFYTSFTLHTVFIIIKQFEVRSSCSYLIFYPIQQFPNTL